MKTITDLRREAQELSNKTESESISPQNVGGIMDGTLELLSEFQKVSGNIGVRKVYTTISAMNTDSTAPVGADGIPLKFSQVVSIYNPLDLNSVDNGKMYAFRNPGWEIVGNIGNTNQLLTSELITNLADIIS